MQQVSDASRSPGYDPAPTNSRALIVDSIRSAGTVSRVELTQITGLTAPSVTTLVRRLIDDGLVDEAGRGSSTGGKPRTLLRIRAAARYVVGVHLSPDSLTYVLVDYAGGVLARWRRDGPGDESDPAQVVERIGTETTELIERAGVDPGLILGLGFVCPGPLIRNLGVTSAPPSMANWIGFPIHQRLEERLGLPALLENDATAAAAGTRLTTSHDVSVMAGLFMSEGIGSGLRLNGHVYQGAHGNAGEVGHVCVQIGGPRCWCGSTGCLEAIAGPATVVAKARAAGLDLGSQRRTGVAAFAAIARLALTGDSRAEAILKDSASWLALGAQTITNMYDVQLLVLTGPAFAVAGTIYLPIIQDRIMSSAFGRAVNTEVVLDERGHDAAAIGAALMMLRSGRAISA
ncbi:putative NBD/HSP70 family sugar kinase [Kribbella aluminosa]|uniref:NBD/HSP70 family sugar kinase n=1 Tax=Kribbella aluminosa TaxID=416017 RepID=A0ABS4UDT7_9ACTN|nr:ROK family transcriptional regulator [Kribbella aluminosa]MBP2349755.1 putative NBD/HSP70 family sugar kinase [Kribbella aluminosa]